MTESRWKHQQASLDFFRDRPRGNDYSDPGTGKTRVQIERHAMRKHPGRLLVICPKTLMYSAWHQDIEKYGAGMTAALAYAENREQAFAMGTDVVITNTDAAKWLAANKKILKSFDDIVVDESSYFKHGSSQRTKALLAIRKHFAHRYAMTGTPNPISVTELWAPMLYVDDGKRLGDSFFRLRSSVQTPTQIGPQQNHVRWDDKPGAGQAVEELIADITIRHQFEDVMSHVPPTHRETKTFKLSPKVRKAYDQMARDAIALLETGTVTAVHAASLRTKLLQIASGAVYTGGEDGEYAMIDPSRYNLIGDLVESREHSVTFFNWRHQRDELSKIFDHRDIRFALIDGSVKSIDRDRIVSDYQTGKYQTLLIHPRTGAHGLTLTRGTNTIISSPFYEADMLKQAIHRIYRGAQNKVTYTTLIEAEDTVERNVYERLSDKTERMEDLLSMLTKR